VLDASLRPARDRQTQKCRRSRLLRRPALKARLRARRANEQKEYVMTNAKWFQVAALLSVILSACATGVDVRAPNGMIPYGSEGDEAPQVSDAELSLLSGSQTLISRQKTDTLAQTSCVQTQPRWSR
jgi:hypothetical protein